MALNQWFKFYGGEFLSDPKIASLSAQERSCWMTLLSLASISSTPGMVEFLTVEVLLTKSGITLDPYNPEEWNASLAVLDKFVRMKMISKSDDGVIEILNWQKRQETALTVAERQARYRENKKSNEIVTARVTSVTTDKNRLDKNKDDEFQENSSSLSEKEISETPLTRVAVDENYGAPREAVVKEAKAGPDSAQKSLYWKVQARFSDMCHERVGTRPVRDLKAFRAVSFAMNRGGLSEPKIYQLFDDWFDQRIPDEKLISINGALSAANINKFKISN